MIYTIIVHMPSGGYYCGKGSDIEHFVSMCQTKTKRGFFHQKKNLGKSHIVFFVKGDFVMNVRKFGVAQFMKLMRAYEPVDDAIIQLLN